MVDRDRVAYVLVGEDEQRYLERAMGWHHTSPPEPMLEETDPDYEMGEDDEALDDPDSPGLDVQRTP